VAMEIDVNRRQFPRYNVKEMIFLTFRPEFNKMGKLKNISKSGVAFEYTSFDERVCLKDSRGENVEVDIFSSGGDFHVTRLPCKVVYDVPVAHGSDLHACWSRRCGLEFESLSIFQSSQLTQLLHAHVSFPVMSKGLS